MSDLPTALAFLGVQDSFEQASIVILPVPYDLTTTYQPGARFGPRALLTASHDVELFDEELRWDPSIVGLHTLPPLEPQAAGPQAMVPLVAEQTEALWRAGKFPVLLGGDHSISIGAFEALGANWREPWILHFDAHADLREQYQGSPFSHACVLARARESYATMSVGVRSWSEQEDPAVAAFPDRLLTARDVEADPEAAAEQIEAVLGDPVYVTIDLDCLDPSIMPATGTPEPGGLGWQTLTYLLRRIAARRQLVGCDVTELSPIPGFIAPDFLAARLVLKVISYAFHRSSEDA